MILLVWTTLTFADDTRAEKHVLTFADARHLLNRTGFGASPVEITAFIGLTRKQAVEQIMSGLSDQPQSSLPAWTSNAAPNHWHRPNLSTRKQRKYREIRNAEVQSLRHWWVNEMISTTSPQNERLALFWHNHFATAYSGINSQAVSIYRQHMMLRKHSIGNFRTMLKSIIRDPAMLNYLDNNASFKGKPNENFAREIMELFTLGEGNYSEQDIKNAARALTGYGYSQIYDQRFVFKNWNHDAKEKSLFGQSGNFNGDDLVDLILEQPAAARFITAKLWRVFIGDINSKSKKLTSIANRFRGSDYDLKTLYRSLLMSKDFWHQDNRASIVRSPVSLAIGAIRSTGILPANWQTLPSRLASMGQNLFEPPNVAGWPGGETWISPGRLLTRLDWLAQFTKNPSTADEPDLRAATDPASMTMGEENSVQAMDSKAINTSPKEELVARLASEEFDGPVKYKITLHTDNSKVWDSGERELPGGHDTQRMGRIKKKQLAWQQISFPVNVDTKQITTVEVEFLNDARNRVTGADRNLYVGRVSLGDSVWLPVNGKQISKCAGKKPGQQGNLSCDGKLRMEARTNKTNRAVTPVTEGTLRTSGVYIKSVGNPKRKPNGELAFTLADVEFKDRRWNSLTVKYVNTPNGYALQMDKYDCWPGCFVAWPECAQANAKPTTSIRFALTPGANSDSTQCMFDALEQSDKEFVGTLWMMLDELYAATADSRKLRRSNIAKQYDRWAQHVAVMSEQLTVSPYVHNKALLETVPRELHNSTLDEQLRPPLPAGTTTAMWTSAWQQLRQSEPELNLASLLLPIKTTNAKSLSLQELFADLTYQLK